MDHREALPEGSTLSFPGMACRIERCVGRGSNALVYEAGYRDTVSTDRTHRVLVKELFPFDIHGHIRRGGDGRILRDPEAEALWQTHLRSFERGNDIHLQLLALQPDRLGGNINTFSLNDTLYTILDDSGSRSLEKTLAGKPAADLRTAAVWCLRLLDSLAVFHEQHYLHLDICLENVVLIGEKERVLPIDYNSVHSMDEIRNGGEFCFSTREGYTAPEVRTGMWQEISFSTDLFSVTAVFYAALLGKPPSVLQLNRKYPPDAQDSPLLADAPSAVREQVKRIMRRGLCVLPDLRYPSCAAMKEDLTELLNRLDGFSAPEARSGERTQGNRLPEERGSGTLKDGEKDGASADSPEAREPLAHPDGTDRAPDGKKRFRTAAVWAGCAAAAVLLGLWALSVGFRALFPGDPKKAAAPDTRVTDAVRPTAVPASFYLAMTPDPEILLAAENREYDPENPYYAQLTEDMKAAMAGDAWAQYGVGILFEDGLGMEQDYETARQFYLMAANNDQPNAVYRLGIFYHHGLGVDVSMEAAEAFYRRAAELGLTEAMVWLGELYLDGGQLRQSDTNALHYFLAAWNGGDPEGAYFLGNLYRDGRGVPASADQAARMYQRAAEGGSARAAEALGDLYSDENGGLANPEAAVRAYQWAAELGSEAAAEKLETLKGR